MSGSICKLKAGYQECCSELDLESSLLPFPVPHLYSKSLRFPPLVYKFLLFSSLPAPPSVSLSLCSIPYPVLFSFSSSFFSKYNCILPSFPLLSFLSSSSSFSKHELHFPYLTFSYFFLFPLLQNIKTLYFPSLFSSLPCPFPVKSLSQQTPLLYFPSLLQFLTLLFLLLLLQNTQRFKLEF